MFAYTDPTGTGLLAASGAMLTYQGLVDTQYQRSGLLSGSGFATLEAFAQVAPGTAAAQTAIGWDAYPLSHGDETDADIDARRFTLQDEYVEWQVERGAGGAVARITFTTEFPEYYQALAAVGQAAVVDGIKALYPAAAPTAAELFGPAAPAQLADPVFRAGAFGARLRSNPWNNGAKGILCLGQPANTLGALFGLVDQCAIPRPLVPVGSVCGGGFCVRDRDSDPKVCAAAQAVVRAGDAVTLADPVGVVINQLGGVWTKGGAPVADVNADPTIWTVSRNGRRAVLTVTPGLTVDGGPVVSGAQVARLLGVTAAVLSVPDSALPVWARLGNEGSARG